MSQLSADQDVLDTDALARGSLTLGHRATEERNGGQVHAAHKAGRSVPERLLRYYIWSILLATPAGFIGAIGMSLGHPLPWPLQILSFWVMHPVGIAAWVANVVVAPEDPLGPQTPAWSHVFWLVEFALTAIWPYVSYRQFRAGKPLLAVLALCVFGLYTDIGTFECYAALS